MADATEVTMRDLYGDEVCDEVLNMPLGDSDEYQFRFAGRGYYACIVGALNIVAWRNRSRPVEFEYSALPVSRRPLNWQLEGEYEQATLKELPKEGFHLLHGTYKAWDRNDEEFPRTLLVQQLLAKPQEEEN